MAKWNGAVLRRARIALLVGAMPMIPAMAAAQGPAPADDVQQGVADIVVTANRRGALSIDKVPLSITAINATEAQKYGISSLIDLNVRTPGLVFTQNSSYAQPFIRGIGVDFANPGLEAPVSVYLDEVYWQRSGGNIYDLVDTEQVQILKGPQGSLYGRNATGGAILISTRNPTSQFEGRVAAEYGNLDHKQFDAVINTPLAPGLNFRFAGRYSDRDGYVHNPSNGDDWGGYRNYELRGKLGWNSGITDAVLTVGYQNGRAYSGIRQAIVGAPFCVVCAITGATPPAGDYQSYQGLHTPATNKTLYGTLRVTVTGDSFDFTSVSALRRQRFYGATDEGAMGGAPTGALDLLLFKNPVRSRDAIQEFRIASKLQGSFNFLFGVSGQHSVETTSVDLSGIAVAPLALGVSDRVKTDSLAAYGEVYWDFTDSLKLTAGGRFNYDHRSYRVTKNADSTLVYGPGPNTGKGHWTNVTPRVVLQYQPDPAQNYYVSYNAGFKSGGYSFPAFTTPARLKPESIDSFELGAKNRFADNRVATKLATFYYTYKDVQVSRVDPTVGSIKQNAAKAEGYGLEADLQISPVDGFTVGFGYAYLHTKFKNFANAAVFVPTPVGYAAAALDLSGEPLPRAPRHSGYASATYDFDVGADWKGGVTVIGRYTSSFDFNPGGGGPANLDRQKGYEQVNASGYVGPADGRYRFGAFINNLTDRKYNLLANTSATGTYIGVAPPRTYGVNVSVDF